MKSHRFGLLITALALGLTIATPAFAAPALPEPAAEPSPAPAGATQPTKPAQTPQGDYAQREAASPTAGDFKGGGAGIYIGGSTLAIVLLIVLLVVLL